MMVPWLESLDNGNRMLSEFTVSAVERACMYACGMCDGMCVSDVISINTWAYSILAVS